MDDNVKTTSDAQARDVYVRFLIVIEKLNIFPKKREICFIG